MSRVVGKPFQKGQSGNPLGGQLHNPELKRIRRMTHADVAHVGQLIVDGNIEQLQAVKNDPNASVLKVWMCAIAVKAINKGDAHALNEILNRIVGKVPTVIALNPTDDKTPLEMLPDNALEARFRVLSEKIEP